MLEEEVVSQTCGVFEGDGERQKTAENYQNISSLRTRLEKRERNQMTWKTQKRKYLGTATLVPSHLRIRSFPETMFRQQCI